jgi:hypothetical protein
MPHRLSVDRKETRLERGGAVTQRPKSFFLDIVESQPHRVSAPGASPGGQAGAAHDRPSLRVYFSCANQYVRVFRDRAGEGYTARCPKCGQSMQFRVGEGGTAQRFFELSCRR